MREMIFLLIIFIAACSVAACSATLAPENNPEVGTRAEPPFIDEVALSRDIDFITFSPVGSTGARFPSDTRQLYVSFSVQSGRTGSPIIVLWHRDGVAEPFSSTRLIVTGHHRMAAGYEPITSFEPGRYFVRLETEEELLGEIWFEIEPSATQPVETDQEVSVTMVRVVRELGPDGRPQGLPATILPAGSREVHCSFTVTGGGPETSVAIRWIRGSEIVREENFGTHQGEREFLSSLRDDALEPGLYRVEVLIDGEVTRRRSFTVTQEVSSEDVGPQVANLVLTTAVDGETGRPVADPLSTVRHDEPLLFLALTFSRMPQGAMLSVVWYRDGEAQPVATSAFEVSGRGSLAAQLNVTPPIETGGYHVDVKLGEQTLRSLAFTVEGPALPATPEEEAVSGER